MGSGGTFNLSRIEAALKACLGPFEKKVADHRICYTVNGRRYPSFPKGGHGEHDPEIQKGHVKKLFRELGVSPECALKELGIQI